MCVCVCVSRRLCLAHLEKPWPLCVSLSANPPPTCRHSVFIKGATDGRSTTVELPYDAIFAVARRELTRFQLTVPARRVVVDADGAAVAVAQTETFDFWGDADAVDEVSRHLADLVEDRRYASVASQEIVEEVRQLRRESRGDVAPGAPSDPAREQRRELLAWTERQLYAVQSKEQVHIAGFHEFFPQLYEHSGKELIAQSVQRFMAEISDRLLDDIDTWLKEGRSSDGTRLPDLNHLELSAQQAVVEMAVEAAVARPIAEPLLSAVKATQELQDREAGAALAYLRRLEPAALAKKLGVSAKLLAAAKQHSYTDAAWTQAAGVLSVVSRVASPGAKMRGLQATIFAIQHELSHPPEGVPPRGGGGGASGGDAGGAAPVMLGADELLPIVMWVLVRSDTVGLAATLAYVEQLLYRADPTVDRDGPTSYCLTTFQQALINLSRVELEEVVGGVVAPAEPAMATMAAVATAQPAQRSAPAQLPLTPPHTPPRQQPHTPPSQQSPMERRGSGAGMTAEQGSMLLSAIAS